MEVKNSIEVALKLSSNFVGDSNDVNNFLHNLLLTDTQVLMLCKAFANNPSANAKLSKSQLHKIGQSKGFSLIKNVLKLLAKSVLIPLELTAAATATDAATHEVMLWSGITASIISKEEINDIIRVVNSLENSGLLIKRTNLRLMVFI